MLSQKTVATRNERPARHCACIYRARYPKKTFYISAHGPHSAILRGTKDILDIPPLRCPTCQQRRSELRNSHLTPRKVRPPFGGPHRRSGFALRLCSATASKLPPSSRVWPPRLRPIGPPGPPSPGATCKRSEGTWLCSNIGYFTFVP